MDKLSNIYYTTESYLFPMAEDEIGEITSEKSRNFRKQSIFDNS